MQTRMDTDSLPKSARMCTLPARVFDARVYAIEPGATAIVATVLITLGRLPKGLELVRAARAAGFRVLVADPFRLNLCRLSRHVDRCFEVASPNPDPDRFHRDLLNIIEREHVDWVLPVSEETLHVSALKDALPPKVRLFCMPREILLQLHHKLHFIELLKQLNLPAVHTIDATDAAAVDLLAQANLVMKPMLSSSGHGVRLLTAGTRLPGRRQGMVLQTWLPGPEISTFSVVNDGSVIGTVGYRSLITAGSVAVCFESLTALPDEVRETIERIAIELHWTGFLSFDWRADGHGEYLAIECNPRATSGVHFVDSGDLGRAIFRPERDQPFRSRPEKRLQQFYPALTATQAAALRGQPWRGNLRHLFGCRDVCFTWQDPLPFFTMPINSWPIMSRALFGGQSFGDASTADIGWYPKVSERVE